jgi:hypothetical protein
VGRLAFNGTFLRFQDLRVAFCLRCTSFHTGVSIGYPARASLMSRASKHTEASLPTYFTVGTDYQPGGGSLGIADHIQSWLHPPQYRLSWQSDRHQRRCRPA